MLALQRGLQRSALVHKNLNRLSASRSSLLSNRVTGRSAWNQRSFASEVPAHLLNIPPTKVSKLPNGMRVATEESYGETATIGVWIDAGSSYENEQTNGVAHFLEHMAFKGTAKRSKQALEKEIENMGGSLNAYTSREQTVYYAKVFKQDAGKAVDILSDILLHSNLEERYVEIERSTILREMEEVGKDNGEVIFDHLHAAAFQGTPLGRTILGPEANIKSIRRENLLDYIKTYYRGPRMVLAAAGAINHEELVQHAEKSFGSLSSEDVVLPATKPAFTGSMVTIEDLSMEEVHTVLAVEGVGSSHPDYFTFMLIQTILGSWDRTVGGGKNLSSRLCETIATGELCHSFTSFNTCYKNTGLFGTYTVGTPDKTLGVIQEIMTEWNRIGQNVTDSEVERAKHKLNSTLLMQLDGSTAVCEDIGRQMLVHGRRLTPAETFRRIDSIKTADVMRVMREYCEDVSPVVAAIGDVRTFPDYNWLQAYTYWNRL